MESDARAFDITGASGWPWRWRNGEAVKEGGAEVHGRLEERGRRRDEVSSEGTLGRRGEG